MDERLYFLILLFPLAGFLFNIVIGRFVNTRWVSWIGVLSILGSLVVSLFAIKEVFFQEKQLNTISIHGYSQMT